MVLISNGTENHCDGIVMRNDGEGKRGPAQE